MFDHFNLNWYLGHLEAETSCEHDADWSLAKLLPSSWSFIWSQVWPPGKGCMTRLCWPSFGPHCHTVTLSRSHPAHIPRAWNECTWAVRSSLPDLEWSHSNTAHRTKAHIHFVRAARRTEVLHYCMKRPTCYSPFVTLLALFLFSTNRQVHIWSFSWQMPHCVDRLVPSLSVHLRWAGSVQLTKTVKLWVEAKITKQGEVWCSRQHPLCHYQWPLSHVVFDTLIQKHRLYLH